MTPPLAGAMSNYFKSHGMDSQYDYPKLEDTRNIKPSTAPRLTPYLGPRSRISQILLNRWTVLLLLVLARVLLSTKDLNSDIESARREALSACTAVERVASSVASLPHLMAPGMNEATASAIEASVRGLHKSVGIAITTVQELVVFVINMMVSTYVCLISLAVSGAAHVVLDATKEIMEGLNNTIKGIVDGIDNGINDFQGVLNDLLGSAEKVGSFFGDSFEIPKLEIPGLDGLRDLQIPSNYMDAINRAEKKLDVLDFDNIKDAANNALRTPFKLLKERVDKSLGVYEFDRSVFPIPAKEKVSFCSENNDISDFFDGLKRTVEKVKNIVIGLLAAASLLVCAPMLYLELRRWRITRERAYMTQANPRYDPVDIVHLAARPSTGTFGMRIASFCKSSRRRVLVRWAVAYATSPPALFVLSLGIAGLISAVAQFIVLRQVETAVPELAGKVGGFAGDVVDLLTNSSVKLAQNTNQVVLRVSDNINEEMFGWLTEGTESLNDTLNTFTHEMQSGIKKFLGGTPLEQPANEVIRCVIGLKIESIQKGLTWLHDNVKVSFPALPDDIFSKGALDSLDIGGTGKDSFLSDPEGASSDMITDTLLKMSDKWKGMVTQDATISGVLCAIWLFVVLVAIVRTLCLWWGHDKTRAEGGGVGTAFSGGQGQQQSNYPTTTVNRPMTPTPAYPGRELQPVITKHAETNSQSSNNPFNDQSYTVPEKGKYPARQQQQQKYDDFDWSDDEKGDSYNKR